MDNQIMIAAGGGVVVGVMLAVAISGSLTDRKIARALGNAEEATAASMADATEALKAEIAELQAALDAGAASTSDEMAQKLAAIQDEVATRISVLSESAAEQASALEARVSEIVAAAGAAVGVSGGGSLGEGMQTSEARSVGETAVFAEGAVRVFVSALDAGSEAARLSVNGQLATFDAGDTTTISVDGSDCSVGLVSVGAEGAVVGSDCGAAAAAAGGDVPPPPSDGYVPGSMASLADGALRVFVSGLAADGSSARLAVNGVDTQVVAAGSTIDVDAGEKACSLTVTGVGDGMVGLEGTCG